MQCQNHPMPPDHGQLLGPQATGARGTGREKARGSKGDHPKVPRDFQTQASSIATTFTNKANAKTKTAPSITSQKTKSIANTKRSRKKIKRIRKLRRRTQLRLLPTPKRSDPRQGTKEDRLSTGGRPQLTTQHQPR